MTGGTLSMLFSIGRPFGPVYARLMALRALAYRNGGFRVRTLPCPVISIGNLTLGGTGKTPHVIAVAEWLRGHDMAPAVVSRGYGGRAGRGPVVVSDGRKILCGPEKGGDEPVMMAEMLQDVPVVAGSDRYGGGKYAIERFGAKSIVLDDGFQHLGLHRDVDLVLLPASRPFGTGRVFPGGDLREPLSALLRASALILTGAENMAMGERELVRRDVQEKARGKPVFLSEYRPVRLVEFGSGDPVDLNELAGRPVAAFCGIANPESFFSILKGLGAELRDGVSFRDHHVYSSEELADLAERAARRKARCLVTTAKDIVKIERFHDEFRTIAEKRKLGLRVLEVEARPEQGLWRMLDF